MKKLQVLGPGCPKCIELAKRAEEAAKAAAGNDNDTAQDKKDGPHDRVSLRQRAWPLIEMMKRAHAEDQDIVWGV